VRARGLFFFGDLLEKKDDRIKRFNRIKAYRLGWHYSFYELLQVVTVVRLVLGGLLARGHLVWLLLRRYDKRMQWLLPGQPSCDTEDHKVVFSLLLARLLFLLTESGLFCGHRICWSP